MATEMDEWLASLSGVVGTTQGDELKARRTALGMTVKALAERAGVDRSRVAAAESGAPVRPSTLGLIEKALSELEAEMSGPYDPPQPQDQLVNVIELPDGTKIKFVGSPDSVVKAATMFLQRRRSE